MATTLVIGSRGSALALWQARAVAAMLEGAHEGLSCLRQLASLAAAL